MDEMDVTKAPKWAPPKESAEAAQMRQDIEAMEADMAELDDEIAKIDEIADPRLRAEARATLPGYRETMVGLLDTLRGLHEDVVHFDAMLDGGGDGKEDDVDGPGAGGDSAPGR